MDNDPTFPRIDALVVGAGITGIWALHKLRQAKFNTLLVERQDGAGGSWRSHRYPGCRNDVSTPSFQYSAAETYEDWTWRERYPGRQEILEYLEHQVKKKLDLEPYMVFGTNVSRVTWNDTTKKWRAFDRAHVIAESSYLLLCVGYTTEKWVPELFQDQPQFEHVYHTSEWPQHLSYRGQKVGVVGTGASGIQVIEAIAKDVAHLTVFQQTPCLVLPRHQQTLTPHEQMKEKIQYPQRFKRMDKTSTGLEIEACDRRMPEDDVEQQRAHLDYTWSQGGECFYRAAYKDVLEDTETNREYYKKWRTEVRKRIRSQRHQEILAPEKAPYAFGTKRPCLEENYFEVFNSANVTLIDLRKDDIAELTATGIRLSFGPVCTLDILILATGFDFVTGGLLAIDIRGRHNLSLEKKWNAEPGDAGTESGIHTHLGMMTADFPNMFFLNGPQAPTAHGVTPRITEFQSTWIVNLLMYMRKHERCTVEASYKAERYWRGQVKDACNKTLLATADTWYLGSNIPKKRREPLC